MWTQPGKDVNVCIGSPCPDHSTGDTGWRARHADSILMHVDPSIQASGPDLRVNDDSAAHIRAVDPEENSDPHPGVRRGVVETRSG